MTAFDNPNEIEHPASVVITSVGGRARSTTLGAKRFLTDLIPITTVNGVATPSATAWSKDTFTPANGNVTAVLRQLAKF